MKRVPNGWLREIEYIPWIILPDELSPIWIGLMTNEVETHDGRMYSQVGGWFAGPNVNRKFRFAPHIFNKPMSAWATVHEIGHALAYVWSAPIEELFKPAKALYEYMATNPQEYFACGLNAFLYPEREDIYFNVVHLAKADIDLFKYFRSKLRESNG